MRHVKAFTKRQVVRAIDRQVVPVEIAVNVETDSAPVVRLAGHRMPLLMERGTDASRIAARVERFRQIWLATRKPNGWRDEPGYLSIYRRDLE